MQVKQLAKDLKVDTDILLRFLRKMRVAVSDTDSEVPEAEVARLLARVEKEKRGGRDASEVIAAALEEAATQPRRRRRRRAETRPEEEVAEEETATDSADAGTESSEEDASPAEEDESDPDDVPSETDDEPELAETETAFEVDGSADAPDATASDEAISDETDADEPGEATVPSGEATPERSEGSPVESGGSSSGLKSARAADVESERDRPKRRFKPPTPAASAGPGGTVRIQAEGYTTDGRRREKGKRKGRRRVDQDEVKDNLSRVMAELKGGGGKKKRRRGQRPSREELEIQEIEEQEEKEREAKTIRVNEFLTVAELAELMDESSSAIIGAAFKNLGLMVTINQRLDFDQIELLLDEFGYTAEREEDYVQQDEEDEEGEEDPETLVARPPVVTVMGHVDHGKTSLLDWIRDTNVIAGEAGGITQHIGAYHVELDDGRSLTFLDTPGHAAFTAMRSRGADVTDIVILVVAADDAVMPQTIEAISHARNAGVPLVVAINKVDLPAANPAAVKQELLQHDVQVEDFGGTVLAAEVSAKKGDGMDDLLEKVLLQAELMELKANPDRPGQATVIEAQLDPGKGPLATILVQRGTLRVGDDFVVGKYAGRVRALLDERGHPLDEIGPGMPAQVLGSNGVPQAGDTLQAMGADRATEVAHTRSRLDREKQLRVKERGLKLGDFSRLVAESGEGALPLVIKGDVDGSVQAVSDALGQLSTGEVHVEIIHRGVGAVNESDVLLAETAGAVVIGFRVRPDPGARALAERTGVEIKAYDVIYNAVDDVRDALEGLLLPEQREEILGVAEVRELFRIKRVGTIAGCYVTDGVIERKGRARLLRDGVVVYEGDFSSLKRFKDDAREVREGFECGIGIENFNDIKVGDVIECFRVEEFARTLSGSAESGS
ncbi:MAG: translation initiation factor IF-2 [Longimicrobiales bacterium]|nr:translation initiation factor IF-2 [Longimicrobiales bacterium]